MALTPLYTLQKYTYTWTQKTKKPKDKSDPQNWSHSLELKALIKVILVSFYYANLMIMVITVGAYYINKYSDHIFSLNSTLKKQSNHALVKQSEFIKLHL